VAELERLDAGEVFVPEQRMLGGDPESSGS